MRGDGAVSSPVGDRHEFVLFFDVCNGNPNGDPDAANLPRLDPESGHGLVSDVALKRRVRNYIELLAETGAIPGQGNEIYISEGASLNSRHARAWDALYPNAPMAQKRKDGRAKDEDQALALTRWMCANFWDIRTFGAVMTTGVNAGQVRGPVQLTFARSVEPVMPLEVLITRMAATTDEDLLSRGSRTMGRKYVVPYALYRVHGFVSAPLASHPVKGTGFSEGDLDLLFQALMDMFEHDRSAARGEMSARRLVVFRHAGALGNARAQTLFDRVRAWRVVDGELVEPGHAGVSGLAPARHWKDYAITVEHAGLPAGIKIIEHG